jgi:hypothetical protein
MWHRFVFVRVRSRRFSLLRRISGWLAAGGRRLGSFAGQVGWHHFLPVIGQVAFVRLALNEALHRPVLKRENALFDGHGGGRGFRLAPGLFRDETFLPPHR